MAPQPRPPRLPRGGMPPTPQCQERPPVSANRGRSPPPLLSKPCRLHPPQPDDEAGAPLLKGGVSSDGKQASRVARAPPDVKGRPSLAACPSNVSEPQRTESRDAESHGEAESDCGKAVGDKRRLQQISELRAAGLVLLIGCVFYMGYLVGHGSDAPDADQSGGGNVVNWLALRVEWLGHWFSSPIGGAEECSDGVLIAAPKRTPFNALCVLASMLWCFVGIAIGSDVFMGAIEAITQAQKEKYITMGGRREARTIPVWNSTVANLTLMALGSSAPEILLSIIEVSTTDFYAGELGPSNIVGSAAFNMLLITAVCVTALPPGDGRRIQNRVVFYVTSIFSVLSYVWLLVILELNTPNVVDIWEAAVTLFGFPALVYIAYKAEVTGTVTWCCVGKTHATSRAVKISASGAAMRSHHQPKKTRAHYRSNVVRSATGKSLIGGGSQGLGPDMVKRTPSPSDPESALSWSEYKDTVVEFERQISFFEASDDLAQVKVVRTGLLHDTCRVSYTCTEPKRAARVNGLIQSEVFAEGVLTFEKFQNVLHIEIQLSEADYDHNETGPRFHIGLLDSPGVLLGDNKVCGVYRGWDKDFSGVFRPMCGNKARVKESEGSLRVVLSRQGRLEHRVSVRARTKSLSAIGERDFISVDKELVFQPGQAEHGIVVEILDDKMYEAEEHFQVIFSDLSAGVFSSLCDGGPHCSIVTVTIESDTTSKTEASFFQVVAMHFKCNIHVILEIGENWMALWREALVYEPGGGALGGLGYLTALPWKLLFAFSPPPLLFGGLGCFFVSLFLIGVVTAVVGDLAAHLGCLFGVSKSTTAITLVAMGTSLPDTFASRTAARDEETADASIGNVTGSNSVNVLLGLGLPWLAAAVYWNFLVPAGDLTYSVGVFAACAVVGLGIIMLRREALGYELGGPSRMWDLTTALFFSALWVLYIYLSVSHNARHRDE